MQLLEKLDIAVIHTAQRYFPWLARFALFVIFVWFGLLKVLDLSPATPLVHALFDQTLASLISFEKFSIIFGIFEIVIGILFLIPHFERLAIVLLIPHMITTTLPLILLPHSVWTAWFVPTLEGQYIIKNILMIALAFGIAAHLHPPHEPSS